MKINILFFYLSLYQSLLVKIYDQEDFKGKMYPIKLNYCECKKIPSSVKVVSFKWSDGEGDTLVFSSPNIERLWTVSEKNFNSKVAYYKETDNMNKVCWLDIWNGCDNESKSETEKTLKEKESDD